MVGTATTKTRPKTSRVKKAAVRELTRAEKKLLAGPVKFRIRHARLEANLTQQGLADLVGCDRIHAVHWEAGTFRPSLRYRRKLAEATGFPIVFFAHDGPEGQLE